MLKRISAFLLACVMLISLVACATKPVTQEAAAPAASVDNYHLDIIFSNVFQPTEWNYKASEKIAEEITKRTDGHISVVFAEYVGDCATLIGPMLYSSDEEYNYVMDSDIVKDVKNRLAAKNIHILDTHYSFGFRSVVTNLDVKTPDDLKGHKLRATSSALFTKTLECLGATAVPMSFTECLSSITSGIVEGFEGSTSTLSGAGKPYELVKKVALTNHLIATRWLCMPEDLYQSIPEKYRKVIDEVAVEMGKWEQTSCANDEDTQKAMLAESGVTWNEVDLDAFTAACEPVYGWICDEYGADPALREKLVKLVQDYRAKK